MFQGRCQQTAAAPVPADPLVTAVLTTASSGPPSQTAGQNTPSNSRWEHDVQRDPGTHSVPIALCWSLGMKQQGRLFAANP